MVDERHERQAPADFTASFDDDDLSMCEEADRGLEIFKSRPFPPPTTTTSRLGFEESESAPAISPAHSFGTATTVSMDRSITSASSSELFTHQPSDNNSNNKNSGNSNIFKIITIVKSYSYEREQEEEDRESRIRYLSLASPVWESDSTQEQYHTPLSEESLYLPQGEKDEVVRRFKLQQRRCRTPTPFLVLQ
jgi:hypothetical protein